jgi:penicillin-binding protein 2
LDDAIIQSCDVYFYRLAHEMGIDALSDYLATFGFGQRTGIDLQGESRGILPSRAWKQKNRGLPWYPGETIIMGIGQGYFLSTPLQLAAATAAIANGGTYHTPRLVNYQQKRGEQIKLPIEGEQRQIPTETAQHWDTIRKAMVDVVEHPRGTGKRIQHAGYRIAGKTGTSQVFSIKQDETYDDATIAKKKRDHALFIAYAPVEKPRIAIAVIVENGGNGGSVAAPLARTIMDAYLQADKS